MFGHIWPGMGPQSVEFAQIWQKLGQVGREMGQTRPKSFESGLQIRTTPDQLLGVGFVQRSTFGRVCPQLADSGPKVARNKAKSGRNDQTGGGGEVSQAWPGLSPASTEFKAMSPNKRPQRQSLSLRRVREQRALVGGSLESGPKSRPRIDLSPKAGRKR